MKHANKARMVIACLTAALLPVTGLAAAEAQSVAGRPGGAGDPGEIVSAEPSAFRLPPGIPTATAAWKIHYRSTGAGGKADVVSGTVIIPLDGRDGVRPLLTYAFGTVGMGDQCAPSAKLADGSSFEAVVLNGALERGWAVVVTDYQGLGTPGDHTYMIGRAEGAAVLDAARAAQRLPEARRAGVDATSPVAVMGYSQGGQASGWAAELARSYAPELRVKGVVSGGVPADLLRFASSSTDSNLALSLMTAIGHDAGYPELDLDSYLNDDGRALVESMRNGCVVENALAAEGKSIDELTVRNPLEAPDWRRRLGDNRLGERAAAAPVYVYHGTNDTIVPYAIGEQLRADWCARGGVVQWRSIPMADHHTAYLFGVSPALDWLAARFAGSPTRGNCA
ncbi:lipase family protein [Actinokineospora sp. UTMC 2448]|uniref:lipase family protein n=1 Tax=Actinokineospora sp. UTMC 2448 TaxID=2268449 RepID=UPI002164B2B0|nr:lipase family protein [Actinokineospora sp. UTMC 2448]UVS78609.1 putative inactive lipase [Actinokineospora sp. UTMC 2448]